MASHFSAILAASSHHLADPQATSWLHSTASQRSAWFAQWHAQNEQLHTVELAGVALKWLQLFDILSLWPCTFYPVLGEVVHEVPKPFQTAEDWLLVRELRPASAGV